MVYHNYQFTVWIMQQCPNGISHLSDKVPLWWNNKLRLIADWNERVILPLTPSSCALVRANVFPSPSHGVNCSPSVRWACSVIGAAGGDLFPSFPSVAAFCWWAARGAMPSCHLSDRVQFPSHLFPSITESEKMVNDGDFNMVSHTIGAYSL